MKDELTPNQQRLVNLLEKAKAVSSDTACEIKKQNKQDKDDLLSLRAGRIVRSKPCVVGDDGESKGKKATVLYWLHDKEEAAQTVSDAISGDKEKHVAATQKLLAELNQANDENIILYEQNNTLNAENIELLESVQELKSKKEFNDRESNAEVAMLKHDIEILENQVKFRLDENADLVQQNEALQKELEQIKAQSPAHWIAEQEPNVEYSISSAYMQRKSDLGELMQRAEAETVKHAKPRTIYQIKKLGVMMPNVSATFQENNV